MSHLTQSPLKNHQFMKQKSQQTIYLPKTHPKCLCKRSSVNNSHYMPTNNFCYQIFPLQYKHQSLNNPMTEKLLQNRKILIPSIHHPQQADRYQRDMEQMKTFFDAKLLISPNRESRPLGLPSSRAFVDVPYDQRFQPSFDNFSLSSMFANKALSQSELAEFKKDKNNSGQGFQTPARKRNQYYGGRETEQGSRALQSQAKKSRPKQKGLRQLSQRAYEIVLTLRSASYKEVANKLVDELNNEKQHDQHILRGRIEEKDEQNIKRRVYDALNVLIALGVLRKQGRKIVGDRSKKLKLQQSDKKILAAQIQAKQRQIARKKELLRKDAAKAKYLPLLIHENRTRNTQCSKMHFPFMIVNASLKDIVKTQTDDQGNLQMIEIRKYANQNDLMKMDLDCYVDYKMDTARKG